MIEFRLPSLGADMDEGTLLEWRVQAGDKVRRGQVVAVVDTSKAAVDVEIWNDGVVRELLVKPGEKVPVGTVLATLLESVEAPTEPMPLPSTEGKPATAEIAPTVVLRKEQRRAISPAARRRARELGLDLGAAVGTGPNGAVTLADLEAMAQSVHQLSTARPTADTQLARQREARKAIGAAMSRSKREIPHYYLSATIPLASALAWLQQHNAALPISSRILPAALLIKAVALALRRTPELNGHYRDGEFVPAAVVHPGVAISLRGGGLVAPALHDPASKPLETVMGDLSDLIQRARLGSLRSSEMTEPTVTISNLGAGVEAVFGVIYPPQVALVGFGAVAVRPWVVNGEVQAQPLVCATLSADHRVSDGHRGAWFLLELQELLQRPAELAGVTLMPEPISEGAP